MNAEDVDAALVEKAARAIAEHRSMGHVFEPGQYDPDNQLAKYRDAYRNEARHVLAAVLPEIQAQALESFHENYDFFFNTRGEPVSAVTSSDFTAEIARLRATTTEEPTT